MKFKIERTQYGIGQGCFHVQRLCFCEERSNDFETVCLSESNEPFDIVYDCGAHKAQTVGGHKALDWAIGHYRPEKRNKNQVIDAVYLSHFQADHINGLSKLRGGIKGKHKKIVKLLFVPHINKELAICLLGQHADFGFDDIASATQFFGVLDDIVQGRDVLGIPTIRITRGPDDTGQMPAGPDGPKPDWQNQPVFPEGRDFDNRSGSIGWTNANAFRRVMPHSSKFNLTAISNVANSGTYECKEFWQLKTWCWKQSTALTNDIFSFISGIAGFPPDLFQSGTLSHTDANWIIGNAKLIQAEYQRALKKHKVDHAGDHNVVSLCLYSGPKEPSVHKVLYWCGGTNGWRKVDLKKPTTPIGWLGTGDALLGKKSVWDDFNAHFSSEIEQSRTVYVPHHGSGSRTPGNYNSGLFLHMPVAVVSAGAYNSYHHPASWVWSDIATLKAWPVLVTEFKRPGYTEGIVFSIPCKPA